ncbi:phosphopantetheine-binding protein [Kitasatospora sp. CB01950]|uniref:phosphopantetheine-binding protein n=1 Tax=Kitasatospora sp. CB01950 TaxID=1703930 RepID=UPI000B00A5C7|nr:phosphopantetheine-binding protein [Kitasatospora sp. CB01950]
MSLDMPVTTTSAAPATVAALAAVFCRILELDDVPADGNFFLLGGDSLIATRVLSAVARDHGVELTFEDFLTDPTPAGLAARIAAHTAARTAAAAR